MPLINNFRLKFVFIVFYERQEFIDYSPGDGEFRLLMAKSTLYLVDFDVFLPYGREIRGRSRTFLKSETTHLSLNKGEVAINYLRWDL